jgi:RNA polymerase sigma-70 factor
MQMLEEGRRAWPGVGVTPEQARAYLEARGLSLIEKSPRNLSDLFLVCGCCCGDAAAQRRLQTLCREELHSAGRRLEIAVDEEDALATLLSKLLVAQPGSQPKLVQYSGRSGLRTWLQVVILRHLLAKARLSRPEEPLEEAILAGILSSESPEWKRLDSIARRSFKEALGRALGSLAPRDRLLLRQRLNGLSMDALALLFKVSQATVSRWFARVSVSVEHAVRRELRNALRLDSRELDSLVHSLLSQVDTSIRIEMHRACGGETQ